MVDFDEYHAYDATGLAKLVADKEVTAAELLTLAQQRAAAVNPRSCATFPPRLQPITAGRLPVSPPSSRTLPRTTRGCPVPADRGPTSMPAAEHATVVARWIDGGLVIFGKTNTPEFGAKGITEPAAFGPARNPWDLNRTPGGSSGGSAAAVAAGIVPCAGASDDGGSIRIPAAAAGSSASNPAAD